jgi:ATP-dependent Clp protease ATP-binding subunit ClpC
LNGRTAVYPFERFTNEAKGVLTLAQSEAEQSRLAYIGTEHLVIGLIRQDGLGGRALLNLGQSVDGLRQAVQDVIAKNEGRVVEQIIPTSRVKTVIEMAFDEARRQNSPHVGTDHLLLAILLEGDGLGASVLAARDVTVDKVRTEIGRLQETGVTEHVVDPSYRQRKRQHLVVPDPRGQPVDVDLAFPLEYSDAECQAVIDRIKAVIRAG